MTTLPSNLLLMDTSMPHGVVAFAHEGKLVAERILKESRRHGEQLSEALDTVLLKAGKEFSDLEGIIIGTGPGSFVGVRVAMATGKGIAVAQRVPLWGVSTLAALAHGVSRMLRADPSLSMHGEDKAMRVALIFLSLRMPSGRPRRLIHKSCQVCAKLSTWSLVTDYFCLMK